ncbi:Kelch-like protein 29 [Mactra antiquata]
MMDNSSSHAIKVPVHCFHLLEQLNSLRCSQTLCDAVVTCQGKSIPVHRVILTATSPYFVKCLQSLSDGSFVFNLSHIDADVLDVILNFIYTGKLTVSSESVGKVKEVCEELELIYAVQACDDYEKHGSESSKDVYVQTIDSETDTIIDDDYIPPARKKRKVVLDQIQKANDEAVDKIIYDEPEPKPASKRKVAKRVTKKESNRLKVSQKLTQKKDKPSPKKPRKSTEPKKRKTSKTSEASKATKKKDSNAKKSDNAEPLNDEPASDNKQTDDIPDQTIVKVEVENGDIDVPQDDDDYGDNDNVDSDNNLNTINTEKIEMSDDEEDPYKTIDEEGRVVKKAKKPKHPGTKKVRERKHFPCSLCSRTLTSRKRQMFHEYSKHGVQIDLKDVTFQLCACSEEGCKYVAANRHNLDMHMKSRHGEARPHVCEFCGKAFKLPNILAIHLNIHTGSKIWKCTDCGEQFNQQSGLQIHIKRYHMGESSWTEMCHMCSDKFLKKADLAWHLFKAHNQALPDNYKMYTCDICGFSSMKYQQYKQHRERHDGIKNFTCPICQKGCSTKSELRRHVSFHGEKKYKCTFEGCSYACTDTIGLDKHIKLMHTHKDFKPYACPVCQYRTGVKGNVDKHIRTVHDLIVVTKHTVNLKMKYSNFDSGDVITKDGHLVASAKERKSLQLAPTIDKDIGMSLNSEMVSSVNNLTYSDYKLKEVGDSDFSKIKKSKRHKGYRVDLPEDQHPQLIKPSIPTVVQDSTDNTKMDSIINELPPLNNYVYVHGEIGGPQDLRLQGVNSSEAGSLYTISNAEMFGLHNKF